MRCATGASPRRRALAAAPRRRRSPWRRRARARWPSRRCASSCRPQRAATSARSRWASARNVNISVGSASAVAARASCSARVGVAVPRRQLPARRVALDPPLHVAGRRDVVDARDGLGGGTGPVLREDRVRAVDEDRRLEPAIADLDRDPLRVVERALGGGRVARQHLRLRVEHRHPDRGLLEPQLRQAAARPRELAARELEAPGHRVEHGAEPAHAQTRRSARRPRCSSCGAAAARLGHRDRVDDERPRHVADAGIDLEAAARPAAHGAAPARALR